jgi:hypothetical protein
MEGTTMAEKKVQEPVANAQVFERAEVPEVKFTAEEQAAADAAAEEQAKRDRLALKAEAARFVPVKQDD